jgi:4-carboxymuconolactone decarboxylase
MTPRIPLPADSDLPSEIRETLASLPPFNFFRMLANAPASLGGFKELAESILMRNELPPRKREVAILRVAHVTGCNYEWTHHVVVAKMTGVTDDEIGKIAIAGSVDGLGEEDNLLCRVADEITRDIRLSDNALAEILARYGVRQAMELILCCSFYNMVSRIVESTRVELEALGAGVR